MSGSATVEDRPRTVHVEHCMGTVFTIDVRDPGDWAGAIREVVRWLHHVDAVFSTYQPDSDISRIAKGALRVSEADPLVADVLDLCVEAQQVSGGWFTSQPWGRLDPTGLVKGWSVERASALLRQHGSANHAVNGGGDMQLAGAASPGRPWTVGICDPHDRRRVLDVVHGCDLAVATSGPAERGRHIVNPFTGSAAHGLAGVTVVGPSLTSADTYATAAVAMGSRPARDWIEALSGYEALLVADDATVSRTAGWGRLA